MVCSTILQMKIHFISIGGSAMHSLAIALKKNGDQVTGSDDEIFEPSRTDLAMHGLLPDKIGWDPGRISQNMDAIILGMHAREDNPELIRARELGLKIYSYPEYIYHRAADKKRVVIGGSHGKTTCTSMIMHILKQADHSFDYLVGARLEGFIDSVKISDSPLMIIEGDEYLSSTLDKRPKFILYKANLALLTGIAWDHVNVFPSFEIYQQQFQDFLNSFMPNATLVYCEEDPIVKKISEEFTKKQEIKHISTIPYKLPNHQIIKGITYLVEEDGTLTPLKVFGNHNLLNIQGAWMICKELGIDRNTFLNSISQFKGANRRLEVLGENENTKIFSDFAHAPSKIKATLSALKEQFPNRKLLAIMELHTFSSLNSKFIKEYKGSMDSADQAIVYFSPHTLIQKKLSPLSSKTVKESFGRADIQVMEHSEEILRFLNGRKFENYTIVWMSSGNFDGLDLIALSKQLLS